MGQTVCERLGGTDRYRFTWVGERDFPDDNLRTLAAAGDAPDLRYQVGDALEADGTLPEQTALETGETQVVAALAEDEIVPRGVRRAAFGNGLQSCLTVPLAYRGTAYGVVSGYSGREDGFSDGERAGLETLGRVAGFAIRALRQADPLVADTLTEVTINVGDESVPLVRAAREAGYPIALDGAVPRGDGAVVCYLDTGLAGDDTGATSGEVRRYGFGTRRRAVRRRDSDRRTPDRERRESAVTGHPRRRDAGHHARRLWGDRDKCRVYRRLVPGTG